MSNYTLGFARDSLGKLLRDTTRFMLADLALAPAQKGLPDYAPTVLCQAKVNYYAYMSEAFVQNSKSKPYFEQLVTMLADKETERTKYKKDLVLAFKYLIPYNELVTKDDASRSEWLKKGLAFFSRIKIWQKLPMPVQTVSTLTLHFFDVKLFVITATGALISGSGFVVIADATN